MYDFCWGSLMLHMHAWLPCTFTLCIHPQACTHMHPYTHTPYTCKHKYVHCTHRCTHALSDTHTCTHTHACTQHTHTHTIHTIDVDRPQMALTHDPSEHCHLSSTCHLTHVDMCPVTFHLSIIYTDI